MIRIKAIEFDGMKFKPTNQMRCFSAGIGIFLGALIGGYIMIGTRLVCETLNNSVPLVKENNVE